MESRPGELRRSIAAAIAAAFNSGSKTMTGAWLDEGKPPPDKSHPRKYRPSKAKRKARRKMQRESRRRNRR